MRALRLPEAVGSASPRPSVNQIKHVDSSGLVISRKTKGGGCCAAGVLPYRAQLAYGVRLWQRLGHCFTAALRIRCTRKLTSGQFTSIEVRV